MTNSKKVIGLMLAAGFSSRFGQIDKRSAILPRNKNTILNVSANKMIDIYDDYFVVIRNEDNLQQLGLAESTHTIRTTNAHLGQGSSMRDALTVLQSAKSFQKFTAAAIFLGDMPFISKETLLLLKKNSEKNKIVRPKFHEKPGHPVIFGKDFWEALENMPPDRSGKDFINDNRHALIEIPVKDSGVCTDIDTQEQLQKISFPTEVLF